jgi:hypothetical protein
MVVPGRVSPTDVQGLFVSRFSGAGFRFDGLASGTGGLDALLHLASNSRGGELCKGF